VFILGVLQQASINHKIIMIHQSFISKSFKDVRYTYTRWACATAAKNIISLYPTRDPEEPQWWVEQAFVVTSSICLMLDLFHRPTVDAEAEEYQACVQHAILFLQQFSTSSVALHGVRLLLSLLQEYNKLHEGSRLQPTPTKASSYMPSTFVDLEVAEPNHAMRNQCPSSTSDVLLLNEEAAQFNFDIDTVAFEDLMDYLPLEGGFDNNTFLDSICGLNTGLFA
jgi:transcription elongation factor SPT5